MQGYQGYTLRKLRIWSHLLKKSLIENFIFLCGDKNITVTFKCVCECIEKPVKLDGIVFAKILDSL